MKEFYTILAFISLGGVIGFLLFDKFSGADFDGGTLVLRDTIEVPVKVDPIFIRDTITEVEKKTVYKKVIIPDTNAKKLVNKLIAQRDSLQELLANQKVSEIAVLDTIVPPHQDSLLAVYSLYDKIWLVDFRPAQRKILQIDKTFVTGDFMNKQNKNEKWYYGGVGFVLGMSAGILIGVRATR